MKTLKDIRDRCHVDRGCQCWHWRGCKDNGLPKTWFGGRRQSVRRVVWEMTTGAPVAPGMFTTTTCRNKDCVQFKCVSLVTRSEYMRMGRAASPRPADWVARITLGRRKAGNIKLSLEKARVIRARKGAGETNTRIALDYGVDQSMVSQIVLERVWREADPWSGLKQVPNSTEPKVVNAD